VVACLCYTSCLFSLHPDFSFVSKASSFSRYDRLCPLIEISSLSDPSPSILPFFSLMCFFSARGDVVRIGWWPPLLTVSGLKFFADPFYPPSAFPGDQAWSGRRISCRLRTSTSPFLLFVVHPSSHSGRVLPDIYRSHVFAGWLGLAFAILTPLFPYGRDAVLQATKKGIVSSGPV